MISYRVEQKLVAANTPVAPPECPAHLHVASILPPPPTISSSRTRIEREPEITIHSDVVSVLSPLPNISSSRTHIEHKPQTTSAKASHAPGDDQDITSTSRSRTCIEHKPGAESNSNESSDSSVERNNRHTNRCNDQSGSEYNPTSDGDSDTSGPPGSIEPPVRIGPPHRIGLLKPKVQQHSEEVVADGDVSMQSPPHVTHSQRGRAPNVKAIGDFHHSQPAKSSGASRSYGGVIGGKALGNVLNIGNFDSKDVNRQFVDVEG